jgi:hypothetical protein
LVNPYAGWPVKPVSGWPVVGVGGQGAWHGVPVKPVSGWPVGRFKSSREHSAESMAHGVEDRGPQRSGIRIEGQEPGIKE